MNKPEKGRYGEELAAEHLKKQGFKVLRMPFRCKLGELDIIAEKKGELYFVEVKTRWSNDYGNPLESITYFKQKKIIKTAKCFLAITKSYEVNCHFSAIGINVADGEPEIDFIEDAFDAF